MRTKCPKAKGRIVHEIPRGQGARSDEMPWGLALSSSEFSLVQRWKDFAAKRTRWADISLKFAGFTTASNHEARRNKQLGASPTNVLPELCKDCSASADRLRLNCDQSLRTSLYESKLNYLPDHCISDVPCRRDQTRNASILVCKVLKSCAGLCCRLRLPHQKQLPSTPSNNTASCSAQTFPLPRN
jgi:hypothetical protein